VSAIDAFRACRLQLPSGGKIRVSRPGCCQIAGVALVRHGSSVATHFGVCGFYLYSFFDHETVGQNPHSILLKLNQLYKEFYLYSC
jgi:hypothetical protein